MTTDTQLAPTDAEIDALNEQFRWDTTEGRRAIARAVLARWGQPAHSGEPVYAFRRRGQDDFCTCTFKRYTELSDFPEKFEMRIFYTAQPVEREPLTDERIRSMCAQPWVFDTVKQWVRITEAAHGIKKGGQHGTE